MVIWNAMHPLCGSEAPDAAGSSVGAACEFL
jgi:hypothetical protein